MEEELLERVKKETLSVEFLTEPWEKNLYATCLYEASLWGIKREKENKDYFKKNHLIDKYNL